MRFLSLVVCFLATLILSRSDETKGNFGGKVLMCYVAQWSVYRNGVGKFSMKDIDVHLCTHLVYAYAGLNGTSYEIMSRDPEGEMKKNGAGLIAQIVGLKVLNPALKVLVSIGGWQEGSINYSNMVASPERRQTFVNSVLNYLKNNDFDGLDIAWAYPGERGGRKEDKRNLVLLLEELRKHFDIWGYILTIQMKGQKYFTDVGYDLYGISKHVHYMNLATHYYNQPWSYETGPNAPLRSSGELNIEFSINYIIEKGGAADKMLLGMPTYGVPYQLVEEPTPGGQESYMSLPATKEILKGPFTNEEGLVAFYEICEDMKSNSGWINHWDEVSSTPVAVNGRKLYSYDNVTSFNEKLKFLTSKGLGGAVVWWLDTDDFLGSCSSSKFPLISSIKDYFTNNNVKLGRKVLMCYVAQWSVYRDGLGKFSMKDIEPQLCTHLVYAYAGLNGTTYTIMSRNPEGEIGNDGSGIIAEIIGIKKLNPSLKILVSVGGWADGSSNYSIMAASPQHRVTFAKSVIDYLKANDFDGLDLAWAHPGTRGGTPEDRSNLVLLLKVLRESFDDSGYLLTVQLGGQRYHVDVGYDMAEISYYVHYINLATHYYNQPWNMLTGPNAPLNSSDEQNIGFMVDYMIEKGGAADKMLLGMPTYGVPYQLVEEPTPGQSYMSLTTTKEILKGPFTNEEGLVAFYEICEDQKNTAGWTEQWDEDSSTLLAINGRKVYSYDNVKSFKEKLKFLFRKGLGGASVWWLDTDDFSGLCDGQKYPLINSIKEYFDRNELEETQYSNNSIYSVTIVSYYYGLEI